MKIIFATGNRDKMKEIRAILKDTGLETVSMKEEGIECEIEENGKTFEENAWIKVEAIGRRQGAIIMADDSGLEVDALNKEPGVFSARFLGEDTSYDMKNKTIIARLSDVSGSARSCRFVCAIAILFPDGERKTVYETMEGVVAHAPAGENGFGYDPIFYLPEYGKTSAELSMEEKNKISHRGKALEEAKKLIREWQSHKS